jgi:release factor glutamine methyltransferase
MRIKEALQEASKYISAKEARIVLMHLLQKESIWLILNEEEDIVNEEEFSKILKLLKKELPIEYITKSVSFYSRDFFIDFGALIPRPESELLVDYANRIIQKNSLTNIAEIGVGSGVLSIMLLLLNPNIKITATDISAKAINIAKINAKKYGVLDKIEFIHTPYLDGVDKDFELLLSNPPYIKEGFKLDFKLSYEPQIALYAGVDGDEILKEIIDLAQKKRINYICCEMGYDQKSALESYLLGKGAKDINFYKDLSSFDRGFSARMV